MASYEQKHKWDPSPRAQIQARVMVPGDEVDLLLTAFMDTMKSSIISGIQVAFDQFQATRNRSLGINEPKPEGVTGAGVSTGIAAGIATDGDLGPSGRDLNMGSNQSFGDKAFKTASQEFAEKFGQSRACLLGISGILETKPAVVSGGNATGVVSGNNVGLGDNAVAVDNNVAVVSTVNRSIGNEIRNSAAKLLSNGKVSITVIPAKEVQLSNGHNVDVYGDVQTLLEATHKEYNSSLYKCGLDTGTYLDFAVAFTNFSMCCAESYITIEFCRKRQIKRLSSFWHSGKIKLKLHEKCLYSCYLTILIRPNLADVS